MRVTFFRAASGRCPVLDYVNAQPKVEQARILATLSEIAGHGFEALRVSFRQVRGKLWEIRIQSLVAHRIFYAMAAGDEMVLLHAFSKKTQKAPAREIEVAERRMRALKEEED